LLVAGLVTPPRRANDPHEKNNGAEGDRDRVALDRLALNVDLRHAPKAVTVARGADGVPEVDVHPVVAADQHAVVGLARLELHEHVPLLRGLEQRDGPHFGGWRAGKRRRGLGLTINAVAVPNN
jgi:hypothetical protein